MTEATKDAVDPVGELSLRRVFAAAFVLLTAGAAVSSSTDILLHLAERNPIPFWYPLIWEFTGFYSALAFVPAYRAAALRWPFVRPNVLRHLAIHFVLAAVFSGVLTTLFWSLRVLIYHAFGLGEYDYGLLVWRYLFEFQKFIVFYALIHALFWLYGYVVRAKARDAAAARLAQQLSEARLASLVSQVNPHFLFNSLNTVSSVMYDDPKAADRMLSQLGDLLRASLAHSSQQEVPLHEERRLLELYVDLMKARFGARLDVDIDVPDTCTQALVPAFLLQPLVENAIKHHPSDRRHPIQITVSAERVGDTLEVVVEDNGAFPAEEMISGSGVGLRNLEARLTHLYGSRQKLGFEEGASGGLRIEITIPHRQGPRVP
jgi:signal transduction histidine kinase